MATIDPDIIAISLNENKDRLAVFKGFAKGCLFVALSILNAKEPCGEALKKGYPPSKDACPVAYEVFQWVQTQSTDPTWSISQRLSFLKKHPDWPLFSQSVASLEKVAYKQGVDLSSWFETYPPQTFEGALLYARNLRRQFKSQKARQIIKRVFVEKDIPSLNSFIKEWGSYLTAQDYINRVDRLLRLEDTGEAKKLLAMVPREKRSIFQKRIALIDGNGQPRDFETADFGLHYEQLKWCRRQKDNDLMLKLLSQNREVPEVYKEQFWLERNLLARRFIESGDYQKAYLSLQNHGLTQGEHYATASWLTGWVLLTFLNQPQEAFEEFSTLYNNVRMPISKARAAYWAAQSLKALHHPKEAKSWFTKAATYQETYYGQLALAEVAPHKNPFQHVFFRRPAQDPKALACFQNRSFVKILSFLSKIKAPRSWTEPFFNALVEQITPPEKPFLIRLSKKYLGGFGAVVAAKKAQHLDNHFYPDAYPLLEVPMPLEHKILVHSLIRQESRFDHEAISHKGAKGLMQLMDHTAKKTAKKYKISSKSLFNPHHNVRIGWQHVKDLLQKFGGDLILVIAAYNAGEGPVMQWIEDIGHPKDIGYRQWIELIPYHETRNYVQRVVENMTLYELKLKNIKKIPHRIHQIAKEKAAGL